MHHIVDLKHKDPRKAEGIVALETRAVNHMWLGSFLGPDRLCKFSEASMPSVGMQWTRLSNSLKLLKTVQLFLALENQDKAQIISQMKLDPCTIQ